MYYNIGKYTLVINHPYLESLNRLLAIANQLGILLKWKTEQLSTLWTLYVI